MASWAGGTTEQNAWVMTDGSLVNPQTPDCAATLPNNPGAPLSLSSLKVYLSTAYSDAQQTGIVANISTVHCSVVPCSDGGALFSFHSSTLLPLIKLPDAGPTAQPDIAAIQLNRSPSVVATPASTTNVQQFLTPTATLLPEPTGSNASTVEGLEGGTPIVDQHGLVNLIYLKNGTKTKFVKAEDISALLSTQRLVNDPQHPNSVNESWQNGISASAQGQGHYVQANRDFQQAYRASNQQFQGVQTFITQTNALAGKGNTGTGGTANTGITLPYIGLVRPLLLAIIAVGVVAFILLLILLTILFKRGQRHKEFAEADKQATIQAQQIQKMEAQQVMAQPISPWSQQMVEQAAPYPAQPSINGVPTPAVASSPAPVAPVQSSALADYPTLDLGEAKQNGVSDDDPTQPFQPSLQRTERIARAAGQAGFEVITSTDPGIKRKHKANEDSLFAIRGVRNINGQLQQIGLFVVADGMGGHANGQDASRLAIQTIIDYVLPRLMHSGEASETPEKLLLDSVQQANQAVHQHNIDNNADMGTTVTATLVIDTTAYVANVGDSRTYLYRPSEGLAKVTRDHSVVASLVDAGIIKPDDIYTHPKRNQIYRSLGEKPFVEVDPFTVQLQLGDEMLLCSDGLWDMVRDPEIKHVLEMPTSDPQQIGDNLIKAALNGGGEDNVSAIVVNIVERTQQPLTPGLEPIYVQENVKMPQL
ncbi:MAG: hypothetical protein NVS4B11_11190 [Ktedonobacteraceae bacterium]